MMIKSGDFLHTTIDMYVHPQDKTRVDVVGMSHFADEPFYDIVQSHLDGRTLDGANVQYEGLTAPKPGEVVTEGTIEKAQILASSLGVIGNILRGTGLVSQQETIEYRPSWLNRDISITELVAGLDLRDVIETATAMHTFAERASGVSAKQRRALFLGALQQEMASSAKGKSSGLMGPAMGEVVIGRRNDVALGAIDQQRQERSGADFAIAWGQAHLPGFGVGLSRRGYNLKKQIHVPAIRLR